MRHYYNEWEPYCAAWLRNLMAAGLIPKGDVDERDMRTIKAADLKGYTSCHFFAGLGGWAYALRLAGWPDSRPVWTGSCPCQPFSCAGKGLGEADERHLWPEFRRLIGERRPAVCFGEQVASAAGRVWLAGVRVDLEALAYAVGCADLCAAGVAAPHIRQRLWWVADASEAERAGRAHTRQGAGLPLHAAKRGDPRGLADAAQRGQREHGSAPGHAGHADEREQAFGLGHAHGEQRTRQRWQGERRGEAEIGTDEPGLSFWSAFDLIPCADGKARRVEPGTFPLAHGVPARVGKLRAYGNAIMPQVAAQFVRAYLDVSSEGRSIGASD